VGVEPSGSAFNSLVQLEYKRNSTNPFINAGAIYSRYACDSFGQPKTRFSGFYKMIS
jgi:glutaminase